MDLDAIPGDGRGSVRTYADVVQNRSAGFQRGIGCTDSTGLWLNQLCQLLLRACPHQPLLLSVTPSEYHEVLKAVRQHAQLSAMSAHHFRHTGASLDGHESGILGVGALAQSLSQGSPGLAPLGLAVAAPKSRSYAGSKIKAALKRK